MIGSSSSSSSPADHMPDDSYPLFQLNICGPIRGGRCNSSASVCEIDEVSNKATVLAETMYAYYSRPFGIIISFSKKDRGMLLFCCLHFIFSVNYFRYDMTDSQ